MPTFRLMLEIKVKGKIEDILLVIFGHNSCINVFPLFCNKQRNNFNNSLSLILNITVKAQQEREEYGALNGHRDEGSQGLH